MLVQVDVLPHGGAYVDPEAVVAILPRPDAFGCWIMLKGGQRIIFPRDMKEAYRQLFGQENI